MTVHNTIIFTAATISRSFSIDLAYFGASLRWREDGAAHEMNSTGLLAAGAADMRGLFSAHDDTTTIELALRAEKGLLPHYAADAGADATSLFDFAAIHFGHFRFLSRLPSRLLLTVYILPRDMSYVWLSYSR